MTNVGFPKKAVNKLQQNLNTFQDLLKNLQNQDGAASGNNQMLTISIRMTNEVLLCTTELIKIYQLDANISKINANDENKKLLQKIKEYEEIIQHQKRELDDNKILLHKLGTDSKNAGNEKTSENLHMESDKEAEECSKRIEAEHQRLQSTSSNKDITASQNLHNEKLDDQDRQNTPSKKVKRKKSKKPKQKPVNKVEKIVDEKDVVEAATDYELNLNDSVEIPVQENESTPVSNEYELNMREKVKEMDIKSLAEIAKDPTSELQSYAIDQACGLFLTGKVEQFIQNEFLQIFIEGLNSEKIRIQQISSLALSVIISKSSIITKLIVDLNAIPVFISLMESQILELKKRALRCLSNIIYEKWEFRDKCFEMGFLPIFVKIANTDENFAIVVSGTICNMCRFKSHPISAEIVQQILPIIERLYQSEDNAVLKNAFRAVFLLIWIKQDNIPLLIEHQLIDKMVSYLRHSNQKFVNAALLAIERITVGSEEQIKPLVDAGVIPILIELLDSSNGITKTLSLICLGNITLDKNVYRDLCIQMGLIPKILKLIRKENTAEQLRHNFDLICSLCQSNSYPISTEIISQLMPLLKEFLHHEDIKVIQKITFIIWQIVVKKDSQKNQILIENSIYKEVIPLLHHSDETVQYHCCRIILNIVFGTPEQIQHVIDCGAMNYMEALLSHKNEEIQSSMLFFLRKIIWLQHKHIQVVINANLLPSIIPLLNHESVLVQKDAVWFISNFAIVARPGEPMNHLLSHEFIPSFCGFLDSPEIFNVKLVLKGIRAIVRKCSEHLIPEIRQKFHDCGAVEKLKEFEANNVDHEILSLVREILWNNFFASRGTSRSNINQRNINHFMPHYFKK